MSEMTCPVCGAVLKRKEGKKLYDTLTCPKSAKHFHGFVIRTAGGREVAVAENELPAAASIGARAKSLLERANKALAGEEKR